MSDIYKIAVNLAMTSNAPSFLASLVNQLHIAHVHVKELEGGLDKLSRIKLAVGGGLAIAGGTAMLGMLKSLTDQAKELNHQLAGVATMSSDPAKSAQMQAQALATARATAASVNGTSLAENVKLFAETQSMFGADNASKINAPLAKFGQVLGSITGNFEQANEQLYALVRAGDLAGKMVNEQTHLVDTDRLMHFLDLSAKVAAATHAKVGPQQIFQLAQQGAPALKGMDDDGILTMAMAAQGMGGFRSGTAAMSMFSQFAGGKMTKQVAEELKKFGLVGDFDVIRGGGVQFKEGGLETDFIKALRKDPAAGALKLQEALHKAGLNDEQVGTEIFKILGRQTTQRLMSDLLSNLPQMLAERGRIKDAQGVEGQYKTREDQDYERNLHDVETAWHNFMAELGLPLTKTAIDILKQMTTALQGFTAVVQKMDPQTIRNIGAGIGVLGAALIGGGGVAILAAIGPVGWIAAGIIALGAAAVAFKPQLDAFAHTLWQWTEDARLFIVNLGSEIESWAGRLTDAITAFGGSLVDKIKDVISGIVGKIGGFFGLHKTAYEDDGDSRAGLMTLASFTTAANDNAAKAVVSGGITGGLTNCNVVVLGGVGGIAGLGGAGGGSSGGGGHFGGGGDWGGGGKDSNAAFSNKGIEAVRQYIRAKASSLGIDPNIAERVARSEGLNSTLGAGGDHGLSDGPFQLYTGGGLGNAYERIYGRSVHDKSPQALKDQVDFALGYASKHGWGSWYGARNSHIGKMQGIGGTPHPQFVGPPPKKHETVIHAPIHLDGKVLAQNTTRHQTDALMFPTAVGGMDTHGTFASPGTPVFDAA